MRHATPAHALSNPPWYGAAPPGRALIPALLLAALCCCGGGAAAAKDLDQDFKLTTNFGAVYTNGDYGTTRTTNVEMALTTVSLQAENLKFSVTMPYMRISGRGLVVFDASGNPIVINRHTTAPPDVRTGFGDVNLGATYAIPAAVLDDFEVRITARAKLPTASDRRRISTGKADFGMSVDVSHEYGRWGPFLTVGYLLPGQPRGYSLYNTVSVSAGSSLELNDHLVAIVSYDYDSESSPLVRSSQELFASLSWVLSDRITLTGYGTRGLTSGSPDFGTGLLVSFGVN